MARHARRVPSAVPALLALLLALAPAVTGCASEREDRTTLTVLAAASLTDVFGVLGERYRSSHPEVELEQVFGSSTDLAESAADGAPGNVLATADETAIRIAVDAGVTAGRPRPFATNRLVIVTAPGNPERIGGLGDLGGHTWVRCADDVPCGRLALTLLAVVRGAGEPASLEVDVRSTLDKVVSGEADAGLVYASDAVASGDQVERVPIDGSAQAATTYWIAPTAAGGEAARAWIALVRSAAGRRALTEAGFGVP